MKKCWAFLLALCMAFSPAAMAITGPMSTEELLEDVIGAIVDDPAFWLEINAPQMKLSAGMTADENGLPEAGVYYQDEQNTYAGAADAQGVLFSDGSETLDASWQQLPMALAGLQEGSAALPRLTAEDKELLTSLLMQVLTPLGDMVTTTESSVMLDGAAAQCTEIVIPLQQMLEALDAGVSKAMMENSKQLQEIRLKNQSFLWELGLRVRSINDLLNQWQQLNVGGLIPEGTNAVIRMTTAGSKWQLEAEMLGAGAVIHFDGTHADGRIYWNGGEWTFDTRDFVQAFGWLQEIFRHLSPDALDVSFDETAGGMHLHAQFELQQFINDLSDGMNAVFTRRAEEIGAFFSRYLPGTDPETLRKSVHHELQMLLMRSMRTRRNLPYLTLDVLYTPQGMLDVSIDTSLFQAKLTADASGMNGGVHWMSGGSMEGVEVQGTWGGGAMRLLASRTSDGETQHTMELTGKTEGEETLVFTLSGDGEWMATARLEPTLMSLKTSGGLEGSLNIGDSSLTLRGSQGDRTLSAAVYVLEGNIAANVSCSAFEGDFSLREERGGWHMKAEGIRNLSANYSTVTELEAGVFEDGFTLRTANFVRSRMRDMGGTELALEARPGHLSGTWNKAPERITFTWTPGSLTARSNHYEKDLSVLTTVLATDMTRPTDEGNVLQIKVDQALTYPDETITNNKVYTVRSTVPDGRTLLVNVSGEDCEINAELKLLDGADSARRRIAELLGAEPQPEPTAVPAAQPEPTSVPEPQPEATKKPAGGAFLNKP